MIVQLKVVVDNPVSRERPLTYDIELSRMDAERGFVESQEQEETLLAVISGGEMSASTAGAVSSMDFKEYQRCLAFCAMTLLRNCAEFSAADRIPQRA